MRTGFLATTIYLSTVLIFLFHTPYYRLDSENLRDASDAVDLGEVTSSANNDKSIRDDDVEPHTGLIESFENKRGISHHHTHFRVLQQAQRASAAQCDHAVMSLILIDSFN